MEILSFTHFFSTQNIIWNNENITVNRKSIHKQNWVDKGIIYLYDLFNGNGSLLTNEQFIHCKSFPLPSKEYNLVFLRFTEPRSLEKSSGSFFTFKLCRSNSIVYGDICSNVKTTQLFVMIFKIGQDETTYVYSRYWKERKKEIWSFL